MFFAVGLVSVVNVKIEHGFEAGVVDLFCYQIAKVDEKISGGTERHDLSNCLRRYLRA